MNNSGRMKIVSFTQDVPELVHQAAETLVEGFAHLPGSWDSMDEAIAEVEESLDPTRISRIALENTVVGWVGGMPNYQGNVWQLHPLVVRPHARRRGVGRALVADSSNRYANVVAS